MRAALWYWAKVAVMILPWSIVGALLHTRWTVIPALLYVWAFVGHIPEIEAMHRGGR